MQELEKAYEASKYEDAIAKQERESGYYTPDNLPGERKETFSIILPPPNATGVLHMGHAAMLAIQDTVTRFKRMQGKKTLWLPGTDHASIATQVKVEKILMKEEGKTRYDLGRDVFLKKVEDFVEDSRNTIKHQLKKMGCSIDWSREAFTLDKARNYAVITMFEKMYKDGLIYRGNRVINWDPKGKTVISNDELVTKERKATLYTFKYSADFPIEIATTRPETKVGDTAVAVHPDDERYQQYIGKEYKVEFAGTTLNIKIIADKEVEKDFGTGALGVTPAHSITDEAMAQKNNLPMIQVIDEDSKMTEEAGTLVKGLDVLEAREKIVEWLRTQNLLISEEEVEQNVTTAERTGAIIEPLPKLQWFVDVEKEFEFKQSKNNPIKGLKDGQKVSIKSLAQHAVRSKEVKIIPERFEKLYFHWVDNYRPWCISRQLWYGHRIPAWYKGDQIHIGAEPPEKEGWQQDEDTLDTWFSSGMWTFTTLGWPDETKDLTEFHPTQLMETGYDILPIWVVRMIFMSMYALGEVPFSYVYLHGLVRDGIGRKMSKSLDNAIDPLEMIKKYGTDATRLSLIIGTSPGNDIKLSEEKIAAFKNFTNKLWNIARFVQMSVDEVKEVTDPPKPKTTADKWILSKLDEVIESATKNLSEPKFSLSQAAEDLREFAWADYADWYLEIAKTQIQNPDLKESTSEILNYTLQTLLKLWHPMMPFVTTKIWQSIKSDSLLLLEKWPTASNKTDKTDFEIFKNVVTQIRALRAQYKVEAAKKINITLAGDNIEVLEEMQEALKTLARINELTITQDTSKPEDSVSEVAGGITIFMPLTGLIDKEKEAMKLTKELESVEKYKNSVQAKLSNKGFTQNAPKEAIEKEEEKLREAEIKIKALNEQLQQLK